MVTSSLLYALLALAGSNKDKGMIIRSASLIAAAVLAWQSCVSAEAACRPANGATCGDGERGSISSVTGNVSLAQGGGISRASVGASVFAGARVLSGDGSDAQVSLGAGCFVPVGPNSIVTLTSERGMICLRQMEAFTAADLPVRKPGVLAPVVEPPPPNPVDSTPWLAVGIVAAGAVGGAIAIGVSTESASP
jgi:hypothetical protein